MGHQIDYYFTSISPFSYLGHKTLRDIASSRGCTIAYRPFNMMEVWSHSGSVPPAERPPMRLRYRMIELKRVADFRGIKINPTPKHFPTNPALADQVVCALVGNGTDPGNFHHLVGQAVWERELDVADEGVISALLEEAGENPEEILAQAQQDEALQMREKNTKDAVEADAIGAPAYVYKGEVFWGQDRLEYLDQMIASDRDAYTA